MKEFIHWLHISKEHPVIIAVDAHLKLVTIHPFIDGNGRTARLLMNLLLMQAGYPPAVISPNQRDDYREALKQVQLQGDVEPFRKFVAECVDKSLELYLKQARGTLSR